MTRDNKVNSIKKTRGLAFIEFEDRHDCLEAIDNIDQAELFGKVVACIHIKLGKKPRRFKEDHNKPIWDSENYIGNTNDAQEEQKMIEEQEGQGEQPKEA